MRTALISIVVGLVTTIAVGPGTVTGAESADASAHLEPSRHQPVSTPFRHLREAVTDFAGESGVHPDIVEIVEYEGVTWRNGSLGCPEPGKRYITVLVDGYRIVLQIHGVTATYHGSVGQPPFRCLNPQPPLSDSASANPG